MSDSKDTIDMPKGDDNPKSEKTIQPTEPSKKATKLPEQKASTANPATASTSQSTGHNIMVPTNGHGPGSVDNPVDLTGDDDALDS